MSPTSPPDPVTLLSTRAAALVRHQPRAKKGDPARVHQARVASRRLREAVPVLTAGLRGVGRGRTLRRLRRLTRALGSVRELDVTLDLLCELGGRALLPPAAVDELRAHVERIRQQECRRELARIARFDARKLARRLEGMAAAAREAPDAPWRAALAARLLARARVLARAVHEAGHLYEPDRLHRVRIAVKKLRYALELAREGGATGAHGPIRRLRATQDLLGRLHDVQVLAGHLASVRTEPSPHVPEADLETAAARLERECRLLHAKYLSVTPALDLVAGETRHVAAGLVGSGSRARKAVSARRRAAHRDALSA